MHNVQCTEDRGCWYCIQSFSNPTITEMHFETSPRTRHLDGKQKFIDLVLLDKFCVEMTTAWFSHRSFHI